MFVGYRLGFLARPRFISYNSQHQNGKYHQREDGLIECAVADTVTYVKHQSDVQDVESEESVRLCSSIEDICYGKLTIANVNLTVSDDEQIDLLEVHIEKGCASRNSTDFLGDFDPDRQCWTTPIQQNSTFFNDQGSSLSFDNQIIFDFSTNKGLKSELDLDASVQAQAENIKWQQETCVCDSGDRCNGSAKNYLLPCFYLILALINLL